jgi:predicted nucleotidyltransferase
MTGLTQKSDNYQRDVKMEYPALLEAGMHNMTLSDLKSVFVEPFDNIERRESLLKRFEVFIARLKDVPIKMEVWIDGSFATKKEHPGDIDLVVVCAQDDVNNLSLEKKLILQELFQDKKTTKLRYECDAYFAIDNMDDKSYWRGLFGFDRNEKPKGIARITVGA